ncbi:MAG: TonB-dependent receptor [Pseudomonadota bacterium]
MTVARFHRSRFVLRGLNSLFATTALVPAVLALHATQVTAQEVEAVGDTMLLDTIILSGTKRDKALEDFAGSVTVETTDDLDEKQIDSGADLVAEVPGVSLYTYGDRTNAFITIRGVGPLLQPLSPDDSSVLTFVAGAPLLLEQSAGSYIDLQQVEVFKGPQNSLFGRSTSGGAINLVPNLPTDTLEGRFIGEYGTDNEYRAELIGNLPVVPGILSTRIALRASGQDGWIDNTAGPDFGEEEILTGRASALWTPTDRTSVLLSYFAEDVELTPAYYIGQVGDGPILDAAQSFSYDDTQSDMTALKFDHEFDRFVFTSQTSYNTLDIKNGYQGDHNLFSTAFGLPPAFFSIEETNRIRLVKDQTRFNQEFRLASLPESSVSWVAGVVAYKDDYDIYQDAHNAAFQGAQSGIWQFDQTTEGWSIFGDATVPLTDQFTLSGGLRFSHEEKEYTVDYDANGVDALYPGVLPTFSEEGDETYEFWTGRLALAYDWSQDVSTYASVARGYKSGGFGVYNSFLAYGVPRDTYEPSSNISYELGGRANLMGGMLQLAGTLFYIDMSDEQIMLFDFGSFQTRNSNVDAESRGAELEATWFVNNNLTVDAAVAYTQTEITDLPSDAAAINPGLEEGDELPNTPDWAANLAVTYAATAGDLGWTAASAPDLVRARVGYTYTGKRFFDSANDGKLDAFSLVSARVGFAWGGTEVYVYGDNLFDEDYLVTRQPLGVDVATGQPAFGVTPGRGRTIGAGVSVAF